MVGSYPALVLSVVPFIVPSVFGVLTTDGDTIMKTEMVPTASASGATPSIFGTASVLEDPVVRGRSALSYTFGSMHGSAAQSSSIFGSLQSSPTASDSAFFGQQHPNHVDQNQFASSFLETKSIFGIENRKSPSSFELSYQETLAADDSKSTTKSPFSFPMDDNKQITFPDNIQITFPSGSHGDHGNDSYGGDGHHGNCHGHGHGHGHCSYCGNESSMFAPPFAASTGSAHGIPASMFGQESSIFGQPPTSSSSIFEQTAPASIFGSTSSSAASSTFGSRAAMFPQFSQGSSSSSPLNDHVSPPPSPVFGQQRPRRFTGRKEPFSLCGHAHGFGQSCHAHSRGPSCNSHSHGPSCDGHSHGPLCSSHSHGPSCNSHSHEPSCNGHSHGPSCDGHSHGPLYNGDAHDRFDCLDQKIRDDISMMPASPDGESFSDIVPSNTRNWRRGSLRGDFRDSLLVTRLVGATDPHLGVRSSEKSDEKSERKKRAASKTLLPNSRGYERRTRRRGNTESYL